MKVKIYDYLMYSIDVITVYSWEVGGGKGNY